MTWIKEDLISGQFRTLMTLVFLMTAGFPPPHFATDYTFDQQATLARQIIMIKNDFISKRQLMSVDFYDRCAIPIFKRSR